VLGARGMQSRVGDNNLEVRRGTVLGAVCPGALPFPTSWRLEATEREGAGWLLPLGGPSATRGSVPFHAMLRDFSAALEPAHTSATRGALSNRDVDMSVTNGALGKRSTVVLMSTSGTRGAFRNTSTTCGAFGSRWALAEPLNKSDARRPFGNRFAAALALVNTSATRGALGNRTALLEALGTCMEKPVRPGLGGRELPRIGPSAPTSATRGRGVSLPTARGVHVGVGVGVVARDTDGLGAIDAVAMLARDADTCSLTVAGDAGAVGMSGASKAAEESKGASRVQERRGEAGEVEERRELPCSSTAALVTGKEKTSGGGTEGTLKVSLGGGTAKYCDSS